MTARTKAPTRARTAAHGAADPGATAAVPAPVLLDRDGWLRANTDFPACVPSANTATPLALFTAWCAERHLLSADFERRHVKALKRLRARTLSPREFVLREAEGRLTEADIAPEALPFARAYLAQRYEQDFVRTLAADLPSPFHVEAGWDTLDRLSPLLDQAHADGGRTPWWRRLLG